MDFVRFLSGLNEIYEKKLHTVVIFINLVADN